MVQSLFVWLPVSLRLSGQNKLPVDRILDTTGELKRALCRHGNEVRDPLSASAQTKCSRLHFTWETGERFVFVSEVRAPSDTQRSWTGDTLFISLSFFIIYCSSRFYLKKESVCPSAAPRVQHLKRAEISVLLVVYSPSGHWINWFSSAQVSFLCAL